MGDAGAHEVCVTKLPHGFSSDTGQGAWSDQFTGKPWCICIWAYSNYILQNKDLPLKCESIPAKVLKDKCDAILKSAPAAKSGQSQAVSRTVAAKLHQSKAVYINEDDFTMGKM